MSKIKSLTSRQAYQNKKQGIKDEVSRHQLVRGMWANFYALIYSQEKKILGTEGKPYSTETGQERFV